jgi:thymidylate synthase ThyX
MGGQENLSPITYNPSPKMQVTQVALRPTPASEAAGRPSLTPELLAASGARYSRNNEGLEAILSKIDPENLDKSVDSIFRMVDYGHASIADMAPVAMFIDGVSQWLAYYLWTLCPVAGGQESSTRYIRLAADNVIAPELLGIPENLRGEWQSLIAETFAAYEKAVTLWEGIAARDPDVARIPKSLLDDSSDKAAKAVARMRRNYGFDRARNFLPLAVSTNVMLVMSARAWVTLCQHLLSHALPEAQKLGELVRAELELSAPRLLKHAVARDSMRIGMQTEDEAVRTLAARVEEITEAVPGAFLEVMTPAGAGDFSSDLQFHDNRYAWIGPHLRRTAVRFGWQAVGFAEIRDLNRHRTGTKYCPLVPQGFYGALDECPESENTAREELEKLAEIGRRASRRALELLGEGDASYVYWPVLGTQFPFEHTTTADKFIYEAELRTGTGAHFRYAAHLREVLALWYDRFPATRGLILEGSAEPE